MPPDRRNALAAQSVVTGIDFVFVASDQVNLDVFFLTDPLALAAPLGDLVASQVRIHAEGLPDVPVAALSLGVFDGRNVVHVVTTVPGGFAPYRLFIDDARVDPFFNDVPLSFKANCPSPFDCEPPPHECPPEPAVDFPVQTLARDWASFRRALLDFASQRYPHWQDRLEADVGVMLAEVMASVGDEMAYYQDRIAREHSFETASQRRSVRRHARLVDYEVHDGLAARGWLEVQVAAASPGPQGVPAGTDVWAESEGGTVVNGVFVPRRIRFEVGRGLADVLAGEVFSVDARRNRLSPHIWDETDTCLEVGATELWVDGHHEASLLPFDDLPPDKPPGRWVLLQTDPADPSLPARRHVVRLVSVTDETDPLAALLGTSPDVTHLVWEEAQALPFEMDLELRFSVRANLLPVTAGRTLVRQFSIGPSSRPEVPRAVERTGSDGTVAFLFTLPDDEGEGLCRLSEAGEPRGADPEVHLTEVALVPPSWVPGQVWEWRRSLLAGQSLPRDRHFTLDDGTWARVVGFQRLGGEIVHVDYQDGAGVTLRFGDGEFGRPPDRGSGVAADDSFFQATYRVGNGARTNVPADAITHWDTSLAFIAAVRNPLPTYGGREPEGIDDVKKLAPEAFRAITYRAVRPEDYAEAAERLPWVARAGASFRWTGSWLSAFVTADPKGQSTLSEEQRIWLATHVDRFRQAGREVIVLAPRYADLDLEIVVCVESSAYPGDVAEAVLKALFGQRGVVPVAGFFHPDRFTFGTPLDRSELEAAVQRVAGVRAVENVRIRRRAVFDWRDFLELSYQPARDEVIRVDNDTRHPDRGTLRLLTDGGA
jgi:hypothetical protein